MGAREMDFVRFGDGSRSGDGVSWGGCSAAGRNEDKTRDQQAMKKHDGKESPR